MTDDECKDKEEIQEYLRTSEAARRLGISQAMVYHYEKTGRLVPVDHVPGRAKRFRAEDVKRLRWELQRRRTA
jgi:DNA-binding transcriptional MerR regulator